MQRPFTRLNFSRQFLLVSFLILVAGMLVIGTWLGRQIESIVVNRTAVITALYVESILAPQIQALSLLGGVGSEPHAALDRVFAEGTLRRQLMLFKLWNPEGRILYSTDDALVGRRFPIDAALAAAFAGEVQAKISRLDKAENVREREHWTQLLEIYAPVRAGEEGPVDVVAEFYLSDEHLVRDIRAAQQRGWLLVAGATAAMYVLLLTLVRRASNTIYAQQSELREKVAQLTALLAQNEQLHERVRRAAARTTALNERFLHRIAADLHDGPGQGLALALMRMETLADVCSTCPATIAKERTVGEEFRTINSALQSALTDLRAISRGLHLPEVEKLSLAETARRAVRDYERTAGLAVALSVDDVPREAPLPVKITLFRLLQESLANGFRHGGRADQRITLNTRDGQLLVEVTDRGKGFDPQTAVAEGHLGLAGMRERVEILGGTFNVESAPGRGTVIRASLPMAPLEAEHE